MSEGFTTVDVVLDYSALHQRSGDRQLANELLSIFREFAPTMFADVRAAVVAGNREEIRETAHKLKGAACQIGALHLTELLQEMESGACRSPAKLLSEAVFAFANVNAAIEKRLAD